MSLNKHQELGLNDEDMAEMWYKMRLTRAVEERIGQLNRQGHVLITGTGRGHEAAQIGSVYALSPADWIALAYREQAVAIGRGMPLRDIFAFAMHRDTDPNSRGRQLPGHYSSPALHILSASSPVGTQFLHGVGSAWASYYEDRREATITYVGDGATSTGDAHAALNIAAVHKLPVIFFCQNNGWAISVPNRLQFAAESLAARAAAYGMAGEVVDGADLLAVYAATKRALARAYDGGGPTFIEARIRRLGSHTSEDDQRRYRSAEDIAADLAYDPLPKAEAYMREAGLLDDSLNQQITDRITAEIDDAQQYAMASPTPKPEDVLTHIYSHE
ncbi:MAG: thiamine pyrophosphate-dependent dehydrogenase E1 component subunit alpha [Chloroflexi bacterium]|nr:thiamine pyrophosphate-dependent dehydrogenase E1 component subunit alpha [Chloroflexota bacterium]